MLFSVCKFCGGKDVFCFPVGTKRRDFQYFRCRSCGGISLSEGCYLSVGEQVERYQHHRNELSDSGYVRFLCDFVSSCFSFLRGRACSHILDYGSGPSPALVGLLRMVSARQREPQQPRRTACLPDPPSLAACVDFLCHSLPRLPEQDCITGWDPFFDCDVNLQEGRADLVLCLEVAEHFERPLEGFAGLAHSCASGGHVAVGTLPIPDGMDIPQGFKGWWYKDDRTHVSFYTEGSMAACGGSCGLRYLGKASPRIFMFQKPGDA